MTKMPPHIHVYKHNLSQLESNWQRSSPPFAMACCKWPFWSFLAEDPRLKSAPFTRTTSLPGSLGVLFAIGISMVALGPFFRCPAALASIQIAFPRAWIKTRVRIQNHDMRFFSRLGRCFLKKLSNSMGSTKESSFSQEIFRRLRTAVGEVCWP